MPQPCEALQQCDGCRLQATEIQRIGDPEGPGAIESEIVGLVQDRRGRYYVHNPLGQTVQVYGSDGRFLTRFGRAGDGPGEFRGIRAIVVGPQDSLYIFDILAGRLSVFSSTYTLARTATLGYMPGYEIQWLGDGMIMAGPIRTAERAGFPLHALDASGRIIASFGSVDRAFRGDRGPGDERTIALSPGGGIWSGKRERYELELWSTDNSMLRRIRRDVDWFPDPSAQKRPPPPAPFLHLVREESGGQLWVVAVVADPNWESAIRTSPREFHPQILDQRGYMDAIVELLDARTGNAFASLRLDETVVALLPGPRVAAMVENPDGTPAISIRRIQLVR